MAALGFGAGLALRARRPAGFDFSGALPAGATLTRGSAGTRYDAGGALASEGAHVARFDHDPVTRALRGLLIEEARTNQFVASQDLSNAAWTANGVANLASALIEDASNAQHRQRANAANNLSVSAGQAVCASAIAGERAGSAKRYLLIRVASTGLFPTLPAAVFDLAAGTVTASSTSVAAAGCSAAGSGRWLCWWSAVATGSGSPLVDMTVSDSATALNPSYQGDGASGIDVTHMQFEAGATPSSRIATAGAAVTRAADALVLDWASRGAADGAVTLRAHFDDASVQEVAATIAGGTTTVPTNLSRRRLRRIGLA